MKTISSNLLKQARQTDLASYLLSRGENIKKVGTRWEHKTHDSLIIKRNMFFWNSRQEKGNSIDFLILFYGLTFDAAVEELTKNTFICSDDEETKGFDLHYNNNLKKTIAYLCKTRMIDYSIVRELIENKYINQDEKGNVVFKIYDELGELVGAELVGTNSNIRFKGVATGTKYGYGFNIKIGEPKKALFFESAIDLISFYQIHKDKLKNNILISLSGLKENIFSNMLLKYAVSSFNAFLCVDDDYAGDEFIVLIKGKYDAIKVYRTDKGIKDWNEMLKSITN